MSVETFTSYSFNDIVQKVAKDKNLYQFLVETMRKKGIKTELRFLYGVFIGAFYYKEDDSKSNPGLEALNFLQQTCEHFQAEFNNNEKRFQIMNSVLIQAHYYVPVLGGKRVQLKTHLNQVGDYVDNRWRALNPFMAPYYFPERKEKFFVGIRMTNFDKKGTHYFAAHGGPIKNFYETQATSFDRLTKSEGSDTRVYFFTDLTEPTYEHYENDWYNVKGFEDYRVASKFSEEKQTYEYVAMVVSANAHYEGCPRQSLAHMQFLKNLYDDEQNGSYLKGKTRKNIEAQLQKDKSPIRGDLERDNMKKEGIEERRKKKGKEVICGDDDECEDECEETDGTPCGTIQCTENFDLEQKYGKNYYMQLTKLVPLRNKEGETVVNNQDCQKNWLPFYHTANPISPYHGKLLAIYKSHPKLTIISIDKDTGECALVKESDPKEVWGSTYNFRGSSPPVVWKNNHYIYTVHIVGFLPNQKGRVYYHRFVEMSPQLEITRVSTMFYLNQKKTVEYISGSFVHLEEEKLYLSFGEDDKEAWIAELTFDEVEEMFDESGF